MSLTLVVQGDDLEGAATALAEALHDDDDDGGDVLLFRVEREALPESARKAVDPIAVASLILSLPGAALAVGDLVDRIRKRKRAARLIERGEQLQLAGRASVVVVGDGVAHRLETMTPDGLLDLMARGQESGTA